MYQSTRDIFMYSFSCSLSWEQKPSNESNLSRYDSQKIATLCNKLKFDIQESIWKKNILQEENLTIDSQ